MTNWSASEDLDALPKEERERIIEVLNQLEMLYVNDPPDLTRIGIFLESSGFHAWSETAQAACLRRVIYDYLGHSFERLGRVLEEGAFDDLCRPPTLQKARNEAFGRFREEKSGGVDGQFGEPRSEDLPFPSIEGFAIVDLLARGGQSQVYRAVRDSDDHEVVLKIIRLSDLAEDRAREAISRAKREIEILKTVEDVRIPRVYDAGVTEHERYFWIAMESLHGEPITEFCEEEELPLERVLALFSKACDGLHAAHREGAVHRDLKPAHVLVSEDHEVHVIDFGLSALFPITGGPNDTTITVVTRPGGLLGTPAYMSPEQAQSQTNLDRRTDVYSLGVILFELICGSLPYPVFRSPDERLADREILNNIIEREPTDPMKLRNRSRFGKQITREISTVLLKALEKQPENRYATAEDLATEVRRLINGEPPLALKGYWNRKLAAAIRRRRISIAAGFVIILLVLGWALHATRLSRREREAKEQTIAALGRETAARKQSDAERERADREATTKQEILMFLRTTLMSIDPDVARGRDTTILREMLDNTAARAATELADRPGVEGYVQHILARSYQSIGLYTVAETHIRRAIEQLRQAHDDHADEILQAQVDRSSLLSDLGRYREAADLAREIIESFEEHDRPSDKWTHQAATNLALALKYLGDFEEADEWYRFALRVVEECSDEKGAIDSLSNIAALRRAEGRLDEAETILRDVVERQRCIHGDVHSATLTALNNLAQVLSARGQTAEAQAILDEITTTMIEHFGLDHPETLKLVNNLATEEFRGGDLARSEVRMRRVASAAEETLGAEHPNTLLFKANLGYILLMRGQFDEADRLLRIVGRGTMAATPEAANRRLKYAQLLTSLGYKDEAERMLLSILDGIGQRLPSDHEIVLGCQAALAQLYHFDERYEEAEVLFNEVLAARRRTLGDSHPHTLTTMNNLGTLYADMGKLSQGLDMLSKTVEVRRRTLGDGHPSTMASEYNLARVFMEQKRFTDAEVALRNNLKAHQNIFGENDWRTYVVMGKLGQCLSEQANYDEAEPILLKAYEGLCRTLPAGHPNRKTATEVRRYLAELYHHMGKGDLEEQYERPEDDAAMPQDRPTSAPSP